MIQDKYNSCLDIAALTNTGVLGQAGVSSVTDAAVRAVRVVTRGVVAAG